MIKIKPIKKQIKHWILYQCIRFLLWFIRLLPRRVALFFFGKLGQLAYHSLRQERVKARRHLKLAFHHLPDAEIDTTVQKSFKALGLNVADAICLSRLSTQGLDQLVTCVGHDDLERAYKKGKGVICITGHIGCWELLGAFVAKHYPLAVVGAEMHDPRLNQILVSEREKLRYSTFSRTASGTRKILRWLRQGGILGILIDQDTRVEGLFVDFFGMPAHTPVGPVILAERTGAAIIPMAIHMNADFTHTIDVQPEIELQNTGDQVRDRHANVLKCSQALESFIRKNPTQWVWMHERWKTKQQY